ncbi:MAG TPA: glucoamylase family protein [Gemmatimonadaceae bacterium]|nr:glucoamylase family protein [Gemmatimonadaceae bacterium]
MLLAAACASATRTAAPTPPAAADAAFLDTLERRTFDWFWETTNPANGMTPDRWPSRPFASIAAVGFALTAYPIGVERGYVTRARAAERTLATLRSFWELPQGPQPTGVAGREGLFYHFLDMETGLRFQTTELSTIDTALLMAGVLFCREYFDGGGTDERAIRAYADSLYHRVNWTFVQPRPPLVGMAWRPERGLGANDYKGYDEAMILYVLALGSPTHPIDAGAWEAFTSTYQWGAFHGQEHVNFAPLFGHQYSHAWIDFRGIQDAYMRGRGIDYFENSRRATLAQRAYAIENPQGWTGYGPEVWGLTASDGPKDTTMLVDGRERRFRTYWARGAALGDIRDDGTIAPTAAGGSIPFAPEVAIPALRTMRTRYGDDLFQRYGFVDAFNPTVIAAGIRTRRGAVVPGKGWFDDDYLGIDQGPIVAMIENHRSGLIWETMKKSPYVVRGLCRAGFTGGWIEGRCE